MTMLSDRSILEEMETGNLSITPFHSEQLNPNSYDVTLGPWFYLVSWPYHLPIFFGPIHIPIGGQVCVPSGCTILGMTQEIIGTQHNIVAEMRTKSTVRRLGIDVCASAGLGDVGYKNHWTVELTSHVGPNSFPPRITVGEPFAQVVFSYTSTPPMNPYTGQYSQYEWPGCMVPKKYRATQIMPAVQSQVNLLMGG
jgi:dCTP deaminase